MGNRNFLRVSTNVCCRAFCASWKRWLCSSLFVLALVSISVICFHSVHPRTRGTYLSEDEEGQLGGDEFMALFSSRTDGNKSKSSMEVTHSRSPGIVYDDSAGRLETYVSSKPRDPNRRRPRDRLTPCSNLTNEAQRGPIEADVGSFPDMKELEADLAHNLQLGGHYVPSNCRPTQRVAIIVPYRDREQHLGIFLRHMHPFLQRQNVEYYITVIEQAEGMLFNRALLFNIGFYKMNKLHDIDCYIFHDVDLLPLDDRILYLCQDQPLHLSMLVDTLGKDLMYDDLFGGVVALTPEMMETVNGFPNLYFGWGGEDDDMSYRVRHHGYSIERYSKKVARYTMMRHRPSKQDIDQGKLWRHIEKGKQRIQKDGLNSLVFHLLEYQPLPLYTWILVRPNDSMLYEDLALGKGKVTDILNSIAD